MPEEKLRWPSLRPAPYPHSNCINGKLGGCVRVLRGKGQEFQGSPLQYCCPPSRGHHSHRTGLLSSDLAGEGHRTLDRASRPHVERLWVYTGDSTALGPWLPRPVSPQVVPCSVCGGQTRFSAPSSPSPPACPLELCLGAQDQMGFVSSLALKCPDIEKCQIKSTGGPCPPSGCPCAPGGSEPKP